MFGKLQPVKDWLLEDQKASENEADVALTAAINEYNASIEGELGRNSEAFKKRVRGCRTTSSQGSTTDPTKVDPSH